jgi:hypothetical protein
LNSADINLRDLPMIIFTGDSSSQAPNGDFGGMANNEKVHVTRRAVIRILLAGCALWIVGVAKAGIMGLRKVHIGIWRLLRLCAEKSALAFGITADVKSQCSSSTF